MYNYLHMYYGDIQLFIFFTFLLYLYLRKKIGPFLKVAMAGYGSLLISIIFNFEGGVKVLVLVIGQVVAVVFSYKELETLDKQGLDAKSVLKPDTLDFLILMIFIVIWTVIKVTLH